MLRKKRKKLYPILEIRVSQNLAKLGGGGGGGGPWGGGGGGGGRKPIRGGRRGEKGSKSCNWGGQV